MIRIEKPLNLKLKGGVVPESGKPKKKLFKITRTRIQTAFIEVQNKEMVDVLLEYSPRNFAWEHSQEEDTQRIEEVLIKES